MPSVDPSRLVEVLPERVGSVSAPDFPHHTPGKAFPSGWDSTAFRRDLKTEITRLSSERLEFDLIGVDASIANAIRRTLMAEVPTVAIEDVFVWNNTSIIQDEVLAHRFGLIPLKIDPRRMEFNNGEANDANTMVFKIKAKCERLQKTGPEHVAIKNSIITTSQMVWEPKGDQQTDWASEPPRPVHQDIILLKMRPGQEVNCELHCKKGRGKVHAKWSPVATASYRLLPHIDIVQPIPLQHAKKFVECFPQGVIGVRKSKSTAEEEVYVKDPRRDTVSREVLRHAEFSDKVKLGRVRDHFLFDIESTGIYPPEDLLPAALLELKEKVRTVREGVEALQSYHMGA
ncbi:RBP11-like subunits of RNA polymerase [Ceraceosorus guamensis]|uniref:RBP11-like subunits of RNA polymerase n=1 Tax=Ceraceosorus guamensis TaxID=1522189 RepID=A0A316WDW5_9BASI|nr:RBP11-like subunits of RNA polymerase [Ceraceosorus guamensis]PWN45635.1 RBP11-like subunits of RNA polymerase [Ceraceosorus guamensis]